jgi:hypothetical protein
MSNWAKLQEDLVGLPVAKRAKHGIHFQKGANEFVANFSGKPCHHFADGIWKPIDTKLLPLGDGFYGCPHSPVKVHPDGRVAVTGSNYQQRAELPSAKTGLADGDKLIREFSFGKQEMRITEDGFRSEITLNRIPTLQEARKLIASESGTLSKEYLKRLTTATDANGDVHTVTTLSAFRTWLASAVFPVVIDPDFAGGTADCEIKGGSTVYATARATSTAIAATAWQMNIGQYLSGSDYYVLRLFVLFDTSSIGAGSTVTQVNLKMYNYLSSDGSATDFDIQIVKCDWSALAGAITNATYRENAYDACLSSDADDSILVNTVSIDASRKQWTSGNLSTAWVSKTGTTYYGLRSSRDLNADVPTGNEYVGMVSADYTTYRPILVVTYTEAPSGTLLKVNMNAQMQNLTGGMRG